MNPTSPRNKARHTQLFTAVVPDAKLGSNFRNTLHPGYADARTLLQEAFDTLGDQDGNFVEQFQTTGFDARIWELYLSQCLQELGHRPVRRHGGVDFDVRSIWESFTIEAVTANRSSKSRPGAKTAIERKRKHDVSLSASEAPSTQN